MAYRGGAATSPYTPQYPGGVADPDTTSLRPQSRGITATAIGKRLMADLVRDFGVTPAVAAGIVGSLAHESGNFAIMQELNPTVPESRGGYGYAQWTGPRREAFESWAQGEGLDLDSYDANYGFLRHELKNTPEGAVITDLMNDGLTYRQATEMFTNKFLRPGIPGMRSRYRYAEGYANAPDWENYSGLTAPLPNKNGINDEEKTPDELRAEGWAYFAKALGDLNEKPSVISRYDLTPLPVETTGGALPEF